MDLESTENYHFLNSSYNSNIETWPKVTKAEFFWRVAPWGELISLVTGRSEKDYKQLQQL